MACSSSIIRLLADAAAHADDVSAQRVRLARVRAADVAQPEDEDRRPFHGDDLAARAPLAPRLIERVLPEAAHQRERQRQHVLRHGQPVSARSAGEPAARGKRAGGCVGIGAGGIELQPLELRRVFGQLRRQVADDDVHVFQIGGAQTALFIDEPAVEISALGLLLQPPDHLVHAL